MSKIRCLFFDDNTSLNKTIMSYNAEFGDVKNQYDFSIEEFEFDYFNSKNQFNAPQLVEDWKGKYDFIIVDARSSGDDQYTSHAETLVQVLESFNIRHCIFTSDIKNLEISCVRKFKDSFVYKKEFKYISDKQKEELSFNGNYFDMLQHIKDSQFRFFEIVDYLVTNDDKESLNEFLKKQQFLEDNFSLAHDEYLHSYSLKAREILETIYLLLIRKGIIPNNAFFKGKSTHCNLYLTDFKSSNFLFLLSVHMIKNNLKEIDCNYSYFKLIVDPKVSSTDLPKKKKIVSPTDLSKNKLIDKEIGESLSSTGIGNLLTFLYQFNSKDHHKTHINMTSNDYKSMVFSFNALFRRLIILLK